MYLSEAEKASLLQNDMRTVRGKGNHAGSAVGKTVFFSPYEQYSGTRQTSSEDEESERYFSARRTVTELLRRYYGTLRSESDAAWIFLMQITLLGDDLFSDLPRLYLSEGKSAEETVRLCRDYFFSVLCRGAGGENLLELTSDVEDVVSRLLCALRENTRELSPPSQSILLSRTPLPSYIAEWQSSLVGIVASSSADSSHASELALSLGIPFISTDEELTEALTERNALIDAKRGYLYIDPDLATLTCFTDEAKLRRNEQKKDIELTQKPLIDKYGKRIVVLAELDRASDIRSVSASICDGIGKFSSEELYLEGICPPDEELLFDTYRRAAEAMPTNPIVIRAFKTSGTVHLSSVISGNGSDSHGELYVLYDTTLRTQLRAVMRAAVYGSLQFALPQTERYSDLFQCAALMEELSSELYDEEREFDPVPLGTVVSDIASALMCEKLLDECDFLIIDKERIALSLFGEQKNITADDGDSIRLDALDTLISSVRESVIKKKKKAILSLGKSGSLDGLSPDTVREFSAISVGLENISRLKKSILEL